MTSSTPTLNHQQLTVEELGAMLERCSCLEELSAIKASYGKDFCQQAWNLLPVQQRDHLKQLCSTGGQEPTAVNSSEITCHPKPSSPRLWQLSDTIDSLEAAIASVYEENLSEDIKEQQLEHLFEAWLNTSERWQEKAEAVATFIKHQEALTNARKAEVRRLRSLAEESEKLATRLRGYLYQQMKRRGITSLDGTTVKLRSRKVPAKVILKCDPKDLPCEFVEYSVDYKPLTNQIKQALKNDPNFPFASWSQEEFCLVIQ